MRYQPITSELFAANRARLRAMLAPNSLVVVNTNDILPTNADGTLAVTPNSDLFYLAGIEQEQSILVLYPDADEEEHRELLFLREPTPELELWEGHKLGKSEAQQISGIRQVRWLSEFPRLFHRLMCESEHVYLNSNEHKRAIIEVQTREARFAAKTMKRYPMHQYRRLAPLLHRLRSVKSAPEMKLIREACRVTADGFRRTLKFTRPGVRETEVEAELAHEYIRQGCRFAYQPIIATGLNACCLHYVANSGVCRKGDLLLMDVAAAHANYNADMTRTIPVSGRFTRRQKSVYQAVLRVLREGIQALTPGKKHKDWQREVEQATERELVNLGLISMRQVRRQDPEQPAFKKYLMHGVGHPLGLDVHDVGITTEPFQAGWVMTVEPAIYIPEEGFAVRLENDVLITEKGAVDLMDGVPIEPDEIEQLMNPRSRPAASKSGNARNGRGRHNGATTHNGLSRMVANYSLSAKPITAKS